MKILFDVSTLNPQKVTGVGVYMLQLLRHLPAQDKALEVVPVVKVSRFKILKKLSSFLGTSCKILWPWSLSSGPSVYHGPDFKLNTRGLPRVVTVHDMVVFEKTYNAPEFYRKGIAEMTSVLQAPDLAAVLVNSEFTKSQVIKFFPHLQGRVHVTYLGCNRIPEAQTSTIRPSLPESFILFLGTLEKRKNVLGVIQAFELLKEQGFGEKLVLAGAWGYEAEKIQNAIEQSKFKADIIHLNYVNDAEMGELYQRARVFFFPSWYEGFGIPVLEAMSAGCPVVTSRGGALEEICGGAAVLVSPEDPQDMVRGLKEALAEEERRELRARGKARAQGFTWEKCAQKTYEIYQHVLEKL